MKYLALACSIIFVVNSSLAAAYPPPVTGSTRVVPAGGSIGNVVAAASAGDMILVPPGTYNENNLLKNGVNFYFYPGARLVYTNTGFTLAAGYAFFDDRATGATTNKIYGALDFYYSAGTNLNNSCHGNTNCAGGGLTLTNPASDIYFECRLASADGWPDCAGTINGQPTSPAVFYVAACTNCEIHFIELQNPGVSTGQNGVTNGTMGLYWEIGTTYLHGSHMGPFSYYGIWGNTRTDTPQNMWVTIDSCEAYMYNSFTSAKNKAWYKFTELRVTNSVASDAMNFIGGRNYVQAEKVSANDTSGDCLRSSGNAEVWVTAQKFTAPTSGQWAAATSSTNYLAIQQFEGPGSGITTASGGVNYLAPQNTSVTNLGAAGFNPDMSLPEQTFSTNQGPIVIFAPINVDATGKTYQHTIVHLRNTGASLTDIIRGGTGASVSAVTNIAGSVLKITNYTDLEINITPAFQTNWLGKPKS